MAQYDIEYACGHEERIQLFGKTAERERRISQLEAMKCPECRIAEDSRGLPELTGSVKQVAWAAGIRREFVDRMQAESSAAENLSEEQVEEARRLIDSCIAELTSASWWIDNKHCLDREIGKLANAKRIAEQDGEQPR